MTVFRIAQAFFARAKPEARSLRQKFVYGSSRCLRRCSGSVRRAALSEISVTKPDAAGLRDISRAVGIELSDWQPMSSVGTGVQEISTGREHRLLYVAKFEEGILRATRLREEDTKDTQIRPGVRASAAARTFEKTPRWQNLGLIMTMKIERSSGNVFRDLAFEPKEAESLRLRDQLMVELRRLIEARKLTQKAAAKLFGVTQPRISDLVRGKIDLFSIETLVDMLTRAGIRVQLRLRQVRGLLRHEAA